MLNSFWGSGTRPPRGIWRSWKKKARFGRWAKLASMCITKGEMWYNKMKDKKLWQIKKNFDGIRKQKSDENEDLIDSKREWIFARELKLPNKPDKNFAFFAAGSIFLLFILVFFGTIDSGIRAGKQILGITSAGVEFLQQGNLEQAAVNFEQAQDALRGSNEVLLQMAANLPLGREVEKVFAGSERLLGALELLNSGKNEFLDAKIVWNGEENSSDQQFYAKVKASREYLVQSKTKLEESLAVL